MRLQRHLPSGMLVARYDASGGMTVAQPEAGPLESAGPVPVMMN